MENASTRAEPTSLETDPERLVAELTEAAYSVALRHGIKGAFVELELGLWDAIRVSGGEDRGGDAPHDVQLDPVSIVAPEALRVASRAYAVRLPSGLSRGPRRRRLA